MGSGDDADAALLEQARQLGESIARRGWVLLNGGRASGVMDASAQGASAAGGLVVGVLPDDDTRRASTYLDVCIRTGMGDGRNVINVLSSDVVIALQGGAGTLSEIALALNAGRTVICLDVDPGDAFRGFRKAGSLRSADTVERAVTLAAEVLGAL
jgi:uncharacterized protein (TIGR00725 family)